jgi:hypothetical protein
MASSAKVARTRKEAQVGNLEAARGIVADTQRYGGRESLMVRWARQVLAGFEETANYEGYMQTGDPR